MNSFKVISIALIITLHVNINKVTAQSSTPANRYPFKSMQIEFSILSEGMGLKTTGTKTTWIDNYGAKEATLTNTTSTFAGTSNTTQEQTLTIIDGETAYDINLIEKTGVKTDLKEFMAMGQVMAVAIASQGINGIKSLKEFVEKNNGIWYGSEVYLGKTCDVFEVMSTKQWQYNNITLKVESNMMGIKSETKAVKLNENIAIDAKKFAVPANIVITTTPSMDDFNDDDTETTINLKLPYEKFESSLSKLTNLGYNKINSMTSEGSYVALFLINQTEMVAITALPIENLQTLTTNQGGITIIKSYKLSNRNATQIKILEDEDGETNKLHGLVISYPEHSTCISIMCPENFPLSQLEAIANNITL